jgi:hypothetical protein
MRLATVNKWPTEVAVAEYKADVVFPEQEQLEQRRHG